MNQAEERHGRAPTSATGRWPTTWTAAGRTRRSTTSRRSSAGLREGTYPTHDEQGPVISGRLTRKRIPRTNDYQQAGERFQLSEDWEKDELVANFVDALSQCIRPIQERMVWHMFMADDEYGQRVGEGLGITADDVRHLEPLQTQTLTEEELQRAANLGKNGPRDVTGPGHDPRRAERARRPGLIPSVTAEGRRSPARGAGALLRPDPGRAR